MPVFTPSFEGRNRTAWRPLVAALFACVMLGACAQQPLPPTPTATPAMNTTTHDISSITLERDCMGCATGLRLELRRDGHAVATRTGKARLRTSDSVSRAPLAASEFEAVARQLLASGYFEMAEVHEEPGVQDGSWATMTVVRGGVARQVFRREDAGPAALKALESTIDALQSRLVFVPDAR